MKKQNPFYYFLYSIVFISFTVLVSSIFLQCDKIQVKSSINSLSFSEQNLILNIDEEKSIPILADPKPAAGEHAYSISTLPDDQNIIRFSLTQNGDYIKIKALNEGTVQLNLMAEKKLASLSINVISDNINVLKPSLLSTTMTTSGVDYDASSFEGRSDSPKFVIKDINVNDYPYLSILMVDKYGSPENFNWLHWEQVNIDIRSQIQNNQLTISSSAFTQDDSNNYPYRKMTPPNGSGLHSYYFLFFFHKEAKNFTHTLCTEKEFSTNCPNYVNSFHTYFDLNDQDHVITVVGRIQK